MKPGDIEVYVEDLRARASELSARLADPAIYSNGAELRKVSREHRKLEGLFADFDEWKHALAQLDDAEKMAVGESDAELRELAEAEAGELRTKCAGLEQKLQIALIPPDPNDDKNIIVEIHPAAGGEESALFAGELYRLYSRYAEKRGWRQEVLDLSNSDLGGLKFVAFSLSGDEVYSDMKFEAGVHRVQRVPATEASGRIHTSTVTVAVLPEAEDVELDINPADLQIDTFRASGAGGQHINKTESAIRITHLPTGMVVECQDERSQYKNKDKAMRVLRSRLLEQMQQEQQSAIAADRKAQVGTGDRSERIRTYNFPQGRVTDHRIGLTLYKIDSILDGDLNELVDALITAHRADALQHAE